jgi:anti-anti-sigma factor
MTIRVESKNGMALLHIEGEMSIYTAAELKSQLLPHLARAGELEIDLSQVSELDGAGHGGATLRLTRHSPAVLEVFDLCNLAAFFGDPLVISNSASN